MTTMNLVRNHLLFMFTLGLIPHDVCASEDTTHLKTFKYDHEKNKQLQAIVDNLNDPVYWQKREEIQRLICAGADPNVYRSYDKESFLCRTVLMNDIDFTRLCLEHGGIANPSVRAKPIKNANSVAMLQLLVDYKADLNYKEYEGETLLHCAATQDRSTDFMAFLCDAGLDPNAQDRELDTPTHNLFYRSGHQKTVIDKIALMSWYSANYHIKNKQGESPLDIAQRDCPRLITKIQALITVVPQVKIQHTKEYSEILAGHITGDPARIVTAYNPQTSWGNRSLTDINEGVIQYTNSLKAITQTGDSPTAGVKKLKSF